MMAQMGFYDKIRERKVNKTIQVPESRSKLYNSIGQVITGKEIGGFSQITNDMWEALAWNFKTHPYFKEMLPQRMAESIIKEMFDLKVKDTIKEETAPIAENLNHKFQFRLFKKPLTKRKI